MSPDTGADTGPISSVAAAEFPARAPQRLRASFEFFPPKTEAMERTLWEAVGRLAPLRPTFFSVTYGAGGSTRQRTHDTVVRLKKDTGIDPAAHLTCVAATRGEIDDVAQAYWDAGIRHIVALRGDPPAGMGAKYTAHPGGYANAAELVAGLKKIGPFQISVAGYPEKHPDSPDAKADLVNLKRKVDAGADRCITQFFFEADDFLRFRDVAYAAGVHVPIVPGIMPVSNFQSVSRIAGLCGSKVPPWLANLFAGLDEDLETRRMIAATVAGDLCRRLRDEGVEQFHFYTLNRADLTFAICHLLGVRPMTRAEKAQLLREIAQERILVKDGPYGSMIQSYRLDEEGFRAGRSFQHDQKGNNDLLNLTRPDVVGEICTAYLDAGADIVATNTFNANAISLSDYGIASMAREVNLAAASLTRRCADEATARDPDKPRFVVGALGPTNKTLSVSPNVNDPGFRAVSFDEMKGIYREQVDGLLDGGVDFIMIETVFDTLNAKAALVAVDEAGEARDEELPVMVSMTLTDLAGRNLSGQTVEAFWHSVRHAKPLTMGLNCSFGATELHPYVNALNPQVDGLVCVYPNAGLPNELGAYDEPPAMTAKLVKGWAENGWLNVVGGCCGTTPAHIKAVADAVKGIKPRQWHALPPALRLSGMEAASFF